MGRPSNAAAAAADPTGTVLGVAVARELLAHLRRQMNLEARRTIKGKKGEPDRPAGLSYTTSGGVTNLLAQLIQLEKQRNDVLIGILVGKHKLDQIMTPERFDEVVATLIKSQKPYKRPPQLPEKPK